LLILSDGPAVVQHKFAWGGGIEMGSWLEPANAGRVYLPVLRFQPASWLMPCSGRLEYRGSWQSGMYFPEAETRCFVYEKIEVPRFRGAIVGIGMGGVYSTVHPMIG
jgi:hypothetical protein